MAEAEFETDLREEFANAAKFVESVAAELGSSQLLELYSFYKQATAGRCDTARPSWFNQTARQKWDAWNALGDTTVEEAMRRYVAAVSRLYPDWRERGGGGGGGGGGWVNVSSMANDERQLTDGEKKLNDWVRDGDCDKVRQHARECDVNALDSEGLAALHWAADRGHLDMVRLLVTELSADVDRRDADGQTALHYAASCGHAAVVEWLVTSGADTEATDADGATPRDVAADDSVRRLLQGSAT